MDLPRAQSLPPSADAPTLQLKVALVPEGDGLSTTEIQALLRKRLRILALIWLVVLILSVAGVSVRLERTSENFWFALAPFCFMLAIAAACAWLLWSRKQLSLFRLRAIELIEFGVLAAGFSWHQFHFLRAWLPTFAARGTMELGMLATSLVYMWSLLIVTYGMFIPNTWRRATAVVGVMVLTPVAMYAAIGLSTEAIDGRLLAQFLSQGFLLLAISAAIAIFGSHRIEVLRQQAYEARKLGQYRLKQRLGVGGMGEVYLAEHLLLRRPCALKLIRPEQAGDPNSLARFEREVRVTATLTHPNTIQVFDYGHAEDGTFYYVMEYLPGLSLDQLIKQHGPPPPQRTVHLLRQVCGALREAHAVGLIHRDIKPSNIILCERGGVHDVAKLLDFGLVRAYRGARDADNLTQEGTVVGTPAYMSPEQAAGQDALDARSDIYSVGALAYFLLTGRPPFAGRSSFQMLAAHIYEPPAPLTDHCPNVPLELQAIVLRCLAKDPAQRFPDAHSLETALAACHEEGQWTQEQAANWWRSQSKQDGESCYSQVSTQPIGKG